MTWDDPSMLLGSAVTAAWPLVMTAAGSKNIAVAPLDAGWPTKVATPPLTGSTGLLAVTLTASGWAKAVPMLEVCGVAPVTTATVKPWLSKALRCHGGRPGSGRGWSFAGDVRSAGASASIAGLPGSSAMVWVGPP